MREMLKNPLVGYLVIGTGIVVVIALVLVLALA